MESSFSCPVCPKSFEQEKGLLDHLLKDHMNSFLNQSNQVQTPTEAKTVEQAKEVSQPVNIKTEPTDEPSAEPIETSTEPLPILIESVKSEVENQESDKENTLEKKPSL